ncbi:MAG: hypothetical protein Kow00122_02360 [Thermoleophilia bacterium]
MRRVNEALKEVLGGAIQSGLKDPRIGFVTVTAVEATTDLRHAKVFVSVLGSQHEREATLAGLRSAEGFLQGVVNQELHLKRVPALEFVYDTSIDRGMKIQALLRSEEKALGLDLAAPEAGDAAAPEAENAAATEAENAGTAADAPAADVDGSRG